MLERLEESHDALVLTLPPTTASVDTVDVITDLRQRLQYAEGLARVCAAAISDKELYAEDLQQALAGLYHYLRALRQGLAQWRLDALPGHRPPASGLTDSE